MKRIAVLGLGNFGTALAQQLTHTHDAVLAWTNEEQVAEGINRDQRNPSYLSEMQLSSKLRATTDLKELSDFSTVLVVLPAQALTPVYTNFKPLKDALLISATKGLDHKSNKTPIECAASFYGTACRYAVISGPGFAKDIAVGKPAGLVAAATQSADAENVARMFSAKNLRVYISNDPIGVELGGILKNVIAIAAGISDGLDLGDSARAGIITRGFAEMTRLSVAMGARAETLMGLSGMGDLVLTATCDASRNRTLGIRLGRGEKLAEIVASIGSVAEGAMTTKLVLNLAEEKGVDLPISKQVALVLAEQITPRQMLENLISRPISKEW